MRKNDRIENAPFKSYYYAINIEIPDEDLIGKMIEFYYSELSRVLEKNKISEEHRKFLRTGIHIATEKDKVAEIFLNAREHDASKCIVLAFNASLNQREYDNLGVIQLKYFKWPKASWQKVKKTIMGSLTKESIECLIKQLINLVCTLIKNYVLQNL